MRRLYPLVERLATSNVPVLIEGETGTGKEALDRSLHEQGSRPDGEWVVFDCTIATVSSSNVADAVKQARGGGTLFFDEIGDLDGAVQPQLLRVLDPLPSDVRIVCATRRDLDAEVQ